MADGARPQIGRERLVSLAAVEALAVATALAFGRVFVGGGATWKLAVAAAASALLAWALERRSLPVATLAALGCLALAVTWLVFPETTRFGLPGRATLGALAEALGQVGREAREQVSPTPPLAPLLLAAVTAVWAASFSIHALAARAGSPLLALIPSAALIGFADSALKGVPSLGFAALFLFGALAVLLADGVRRMREWGILRPWRGPSGRARSLVGRGAGGVAMLTVLTAVLAPGVLPGFGSRGVLDLRSDGNGTSIDPLVSIRSTLNRRTTQELFRVDAQSASYWRMLALDRFDGATWSSADLDGSTSPVIESGQSMAFDDPPPDARTLTQRVRVVADLQFPWIPAAYAPTDIALDQGSFRYNRRLGMAVAPEPLQRGETYEVTSRLRAPTAAQLEAEAFPPPTAPTPYTQLPDSLPDEIRAIAQQWTAEAVTPFDKIMAIQEHLLSRFRYDATVPAAAGDDAIVSFLTRTRAGFCQQFAGSMAVLVRALGYPARVAVGFTSGTQTGDGAWAVSTRDAHAWVEVDFPDYGWLAFEPTPHRTNPTAESYLAPAAERCPTGDCSGGGRKAPGVGGRTAGRSDERLVRAARKHPPANPVASRPAAAPDRRPFPTGRLALALAALAVLVLLAIPPVKLARRRIRLARASRRPPREMVLAAYDVFGARAGDLGLERRPGETMRDYERRLSAAARFSDGDLERLTSLASRAAYARDPVADADARGAARAARRAFVDLRRARGRTRQLVGIYRRGL